MSFLRTAIVLALLVPATTTLAQAVSEPQLKAAFMINFAKLTTWQDLASTAPITLCTVGDDDVASAVAHLVQGQRVDGHALAASRLSLDADWAPCQILFLGQTGATRAVGRLRGEASGTPVTVSDEQGFASNGGMIEFFNEGSRLRFAVNLGQVDEARVVLSSRLLQLARIVGDSRVH